MITDTINPLGLEDKLYTVEEFALALRTKFGANDNLPDSVLVDIFIKKYPIYSCKIKNKKDQLNKNSCSCC
tara:strand:+ start:4391 stop:4603 length:213 start_codon:yes stop_codon:yes gene_type:complete